MLQFLSQLRDWIPTTLVVSLALPSSDARKSDALAIGPQSSSFMGLPYRVLTMNHKKELLRGWLNPFRGIPKRNCFRAEYKPQKGPT